MKQTKKMLGYSLAPIFLLAALLLFVLDHFNVDVNPVTAYTAKEKR
jgi:hypothetical protein